MSRFRHVVLAFGLAGCAPTDDLCELIDCQASGETGDSASGGGSGDGDGDSESGDGDGDSGNGDGDGDSGDGDGDSGDGDGDGDSGECVSQPPECAQFVACIAALLPNQAENVEEQYGADGACWCGSADEINECYTTCVEQVQDALDTMNGQLEPACHPDSCALDELEPDQPYGPIIGGACPDYDEGGNSVPQVAFESPFGVPGGFCSPQCTGLSNYCPDHSQTTAAGTCYIAEGESSYCVARCWVDPQIVGGAQCPCGARCQPHGAPDGEGNLRGLCTYE